MNLSKAYEFFLDHIYGIMVIDRDGNVVYMNRQCADYIKVDLASSIGKYVTDVFPPSNMQNLLTGDKRVNSNFYFADGRMSFSMQVQLREGDAIVGVLEYDLIQDADALEDFVAKYTKILAEERKIDREQFRNLRRTNYSIGDLIGSSPKMIELKSRIMQAATTNSTVVITGETGTGKELVAHSIHNLSARTFGNFIKINAAGFPESLAESEFFGYDEGAFTGAKKGGKKGKFELADAGTLFIDEINQMPLSLQPKILRALQEREIDRVGGVGSVRIDVRIIAATNRDLEELVREGSFREDLFYRLNVLPIRIPPLRERKEDLPELVMDKIVKLNLELGKNIIYVDDAVHNRLRSHDWPGNVRELHNALEQAMNYAEGDTLRAEYFNLRIDNSRLDLSKLSSFENPIEAIRREAERKLINDILAMFDGNRSKTADYLKISRPLLYQKMARLGIKTMK
jgi:transcriptional regulator with PAS, ATPase and Fis domain